MKLSELKKMVAEEYSRYLMEQEAPMPGGAPMPPTGGPAISVADDDIQMGQDPEEMLRNIYDMLKGHFEAEEMGMGDMGAGAPPMPGAVPPPPPAPDMGDDDMGDEDMIDMDDDEEEETIDENSSTEASTQKTGYKPFAQKKHGVNAPYNKKAGGGSTKNAGYDAGSKALQERFKKLANIIK